MTTTSEPPASLEASPAKTKIEPDESADSRSSRIKRLKAKLINEEHRLVLMKKIRQSQTRPVPPANSTPNAAAAHTNNKVNNHIANHNASSLTSSLGGSVSRKLRPMGQLHHNASQLQQQLHKSLGDSNSQLAGAAQSSLNQTPAHAHQRPKINTLWNPPPQQSRHPTPVGLAAPHVGNLSRQPITTPPNVVQLMNNLAAGSPQSLLMNQIVSAAAAGSSPASSSSSRRPQLQQSPFNKSQQVAAAAQLLLQQQQQNKRPNFKSSIQKQIEQTLMQQQSKHGSPGLGFSQNVNKRAVGVTSPHVGNMSRQPITTPPNVVQDLRGPGLGGQQSLLTSSGSMSSSRLRPGSQQQSPGQQTPFNKAQAAQMLLQKRTAAKSAIQKQLEQTLMQLPQKQIQVGIDFIPNANNVEFVYYVGLEACVDYLTDTKNPLDVQPLDKPLECSTCGTDFTPSWSWKRSNAVCENCVSNHVKKSIKNAQANRIKSVLAKAAKQDQEMDQRIMAEAANVVSASSPLANITQQSSQQKHSLLQPASHHQQRTSSNSSTTMSNSSGWPRTNASPLNTGANSRTSTTSTSSTAPSASASAIASNPLAALQPAALANLLQMNPQFNALASLMNPSQPVPTSTANNNTNQLAQVAALLMNQLTMNLWKR